MIPLRLEEKAKADIKDAFLWYNQQKPGLGNLFLESVKEQINRIQRNPKLFIVASRKIRKARLTKFPYSIFFLLKESEIIIIAVFHSSRDPKIWKDRIIH